MICILLPLSAPADLITSLKACGIPYAFAI